MILAQFAIFGHFSLELYTTYHVSVFVFSLFSATYSFFLMSPHSYRASPSVAAAFDCISFYLIRSLEFNYI